MKIQLDSIEFSITEERLGKIKHWIQGGQIKKAIQTSKDTWNYHLKAEDMLIECEMSYGKNNVKKINCACGQGNRINPCIHAWTLAYWHYINIVQEKNKASNPVIKLESRAQIIQKLSIVPQDELIRFINISLKIHPSLNAWARLAFLHHESEEHIYDSYLEALDYFTISGKDLSAFSKVKHYKQQLALLDTLYDIGIQQFINGEVYLPVQSMLAAVIQSYKWLLQYQDINTDKLKLVIQKLHLVLFQLIKGIKAPDLRETIYTLVHTTLSKNNYYLLFDEENLFQLLIFCFQEKNYKTRTIQLIEDKINTEPHFFKEGITPILFLAKLFPTNAFIKIIDQYQLFDRIPSPHWLSLIQYIKDRSQVKESAKFFEYFVAKHPSMDVKHFAADAYLKLLIIEQETDKLNKWSRIYSLQFQHLAFGQIWMTSANPEPTEIQKYIEECNHQANHVKHYLLDLLNNMNQDHFLFEELSKLDQIETIMKYDHRLLNSEPQKMIQLFVKLTKNHLNQYVGAPAFQFMDKIKSHLLTQGSKEHMKIYTQEINQLFPERQSILNQ